MTPIFPSATVKNIRAAGHDEYWLQDMICANPKLLGLGDLEVVGKERRHSTGGRLDILLRDPESEDMYEVEVMLGETDESHIIRTIEYWDIEKRRWPKRSHTAVLVAEKINSRFQNVVNLFGTAIPLIGIQANLVELEGKTGLLFTKIIDSYEEPDLGLPQEKSDEAAWRASAPHLLPVAQELKGLLESVYADPVEIGFVQQYISLTLGDLDRIWIHKRKVGQCRLEFRMNSEKIDAAIDDLLNANLQATKLDKYLRMTIPTATIAQNRAAFIRVIEAMESKNLTKKLPS